MTNGQHSNEARKYETVEQRTREQVEAMLISSDAKQIVRALLSATYYDPDWRWVQAQCLFFLRHADVEVRRNAANCLGLLIVFHNKLDAQVVVPALEKAAEDPQVKAWAEDSLADIEHSLKPRREI
jgi:hypothetical protein